MHDCGFKALMKINDSSFGVGNDHSLSADNRQVIKP